MAYEGAVLADINSFYSKTTEYIATNKWKYSLAIPVVEHNKLNGDTFGQAVADGVAASGYVGSYQYEYSAMQVGDYIVYNIVISKK